jgi:hypothetical protein
MEKKIENANLFYDLSKPFETREEAEQALDDFAEAVAELRERFHIAEISVAMRVNVAGEGGGPLLCTLSRGDSEKVESLTAYAFGSAAEKRRQYVKALIEAGTEDAKDKPEAQA